MPIKKVYDEEILLSSVLNDGFIGNYPAFQELLVLAKYYRNEYGYGQRRIYKSVMEFCKEKYGEDFFEEGFHYSVNRASKSAIKDSEFRKPKYPIIITQNELDVINQIKDFKLQKLLVACVAFAKMSGSKGTFSSTKKDIAFIIRISGERYNYKRFIEELSPLARKYGVFEHRIVRGGDFYQLMVKPEGDGIIVSKNIMTVIDTYQTMRGGFIIWCRECGKELVREANKQLLCNSCSSILSKERAKIGMRNIRSEKQL